MIKLLIMMMVLLPHIAHSHILAGKRLFPSTLAIDDPGVADELIFLYNYLDESDQNTQTITVNWAKTITPTFQLEFNETYDMILPIGGKRMYGFDNLSINAKYQCYTNAKHEAVISVGVETDIGGSGSRQVADSFSTFTPSFYFGKGLNEVPDSYKYLRPLAFTGVIGVSFPTKNENPKTFNWGFTIQYSLLYLQSYVKDIDMKEPEKRMIPLIEFPMTTNLTGPDKGLTTGTINPGVIWVKQKFQMGFEFQIPINKDSGKNVGFIFQIDLFTDTLFPKTLGKPLFLGDRYER